ncbi:MOSC N-terminal beta barrel domain-containing protein [Nonomuraea sp. NPDC005650]|uniref:MOSC N-terminal beta barrel domain-containing protein n=1 Tax=Nonomuraea sp. NPDC005650 TaxID=3157045 RepID=UPI0033A64DFB
MYLETLRRYPVKSMLGEEVSESEVTERGLAGDRVRAVLDVATGKIASAKNPRLWRGLLTIEGTGVPGDEELSTLLGREGSARSARAAPWRPSATGPTW